MMTTRIRRPDIEISVKNRSVDEIVGWLAHNSEHCELLKRLNQIYALRVQHQKRRLTVFVQAPPFGGCWSTIRFHGSQLPWNNAQDCADKLSRMLGTPCKDRVSELDTSYYLRRFLYGNQVSPRWNNLLIGAGLLVTILALGMFTLSQLLWNPGAYGLITGLVSSLLLGIGLMTAVAALLRMRLRQTFTFLDNDDDDRTSPP